MNHKLKSFLRPFLFVYSLVLLSSAFALDEVSFLEKNQALLDKALKLTSQEELLLELVKLKDPEGIQKKIEAKEKRLKGLSETLNAYQLKKEELALKIAQEHSNHSEIKKLTNTKGVDRQKKSLEKELSTLNKELDRLKNPSWSLSSKRNGKIAEIEKVKKELAFLVPYHATGVERTERANPKYYKIIKSEAKSYFRKGFLNRISYQEIADHLNIKNNIFSRRRSLKSKIASLNNELNKIPTKITPDSKKIASKESEVSKKKDELIKLSRSSLKVGGIADSDKLLEVGLKISEASQNKYLKFHTAFLNEVEALAQKTQAASEKLLSGYAQKVDAQMSLKDKLLSVNSSDRSSVYPTNYFSEGLCQSQFSRMVNEHFLALIEKEIYTAQSNDFRSRRLIKKLKSRRDNGRGFPLQNCKRVSELISADSQLMGGLDLLFKTQSKEALFDSLEVGKKALLLEIYEKFKASAQEISGKCQDYRHEPSKDYPLKEYSEDLNSGFYPYVNKFNKTVANSDDYQKELSDQRLSLEAQKSSQLAFNQDLEKLKAQLNLLQSAVSATGVSPDYEAIECAKNSQALSLCLAEASKNKYLKNHAIFDSAPRYVNNNEKLFLAKSKTQDENGAVILPETLAQFSQGSENCEEIFEKNQKELSAIVADTQGASNHRAHASAKSETVSELIKNKKNLHAHRNKKLYDDPRPLSEQNNHDYSELCAQRDLIVPAEEFYSFSQKSLEKDAPISFSKSLQANSELNATLFEFCQETTQGTLRAFLAEALERCLEACDSEAGCSAQCFQAYDGLRTQALIRPASGSELVSVETLHSDARGRVCLQPDEILQGSYLEELRKVKNAQTQKTLEARKTRLKSSLNLSQSTKEKNSTLDPEVSNWLSFRRHLKSESVKELQEALTGNFPYALRGFERIQEMAKGIDPLKLSHLKEKSIWMMTQGNAEEFIDFYNTNKNEIEAVIDDIEKEKFPELFAMNVEFKSPDYFYTSLNTKQHILKEHESALQDYLKKSCSDLSKSIDELSDDWQSQCHDSCKKVEAQTAENHSEAASQECRQYCHASTKDLHQVASGLSDQDIDQGIGQRLDCLEIVKKGALPDNSDESFLKFLIKTPRDESIQKIVVLDQYSKGSTENNSERSQLIESSEGGVFFGDSQSLSLEDLNHCHSDLSSLRASELPMCTEICKDTLVVRLPTLDSSHQELYSKEMDALNRQSIVRLKINKSLSEFVKNEDATVLEALQPVFVKPRILKALPYVPPPKHQK